MKIFFNFKSVLAISILFLLTSCGNNNNAELEKLKAENKKLQISNKAVLKKLENTELDYENLKKMATLFRESIVDNDQRTVWLIN